MILFLFTSAYLLIVLYYSAYTLRYLDEVKQRINIYKRNKDYWKKVYTREIFAISSILILNIIQDNLKIFNYGTSILKILFDIFEIFFIYETWFYLFHRNEHKIEKIKGITNHDVHHEFKYPLPMDYIYSDTFDFIFGLIGIFLPVFLSYMNIYKLSYYSFLISCIIRTLNEIEVHNHHNINNKYSMFYILQKPRHHIRHHIYKKGNYGSTFGIYDKIFNTEY